MAKPYQHLFFDLDHTLWDFEKNSQEALIELYDSYQWESVLNLSVDEFLKTYYAKNDEMWALYRDHKIDKETLRHRRFAETFATFQYDHDAKVAQFEKDYIALAPQKTALFPGCLEMLKSLEANFRMHIITNGFEETQFIKLEKSGLRPYFQEIVTSDRIGVNKPEAKIFLAAMTEAGATRKDSLMIGDNLLADIIGAKKVGMDQVYFNPKKEKHQQKVTYEITNLSELKVLLLPLG